MKRVLVVGEDALCCALGERLVEAALPDWQLAGPSIDKKGVTKLIPDLYRYAEQARHVQPVLCIADTDGKCPKELLSHWLPAQAPVQFVLRLAVTEAESWLLADRQGFSAALQVPISKLPHITDNIVDPKRLLLSLATKSKSRQFREEIVSPRDASKPGSGYNQHLCAFVKKVWNAQSARSVSPSLHRALNCVQTMDQGRV